VALHGYLEAVEYDPPVKVNDHLPEALGHLTDHILRARHAADHGHRLEVAVEGHQELAVDVVLLLIRRRVADSHRTDAAPAA
jgi:hypothetical protein